MIHIGGKEITGIWVGEKALTALWVGTRMVWTAVRSCFGNGFWRGDKPWRGTDGWRRS